jgi:endonuclease/exonuclease/phosphatase (EEP) superfamily protein YafD
MFLTGLQLLIFTLGYLLVVISLIPLVRNDNWVFRVFEYPRSQKLLINLFLLAAFTAVAELHVTYHKIFLALLVLNALYLFYQIWPYTFLAKKQMKKSSGADSKRQFRLLIANVYQDNGDIGLCVQSIKHYSPDVALLVETDERWLAKLDESLGSQFKYRVAEPLNNTYGMVLYSNFKLINPEIKYLVENDIPSIHAEIEIGSGDYIKLYGLHPKPPVPQETARSTERDAEILLVAKEAVRCKIPVIVAGDLNDVAWSYTTDLFLKVSKLLDPRRGRGFYNTFNAHYWFLRWPLDHVFCSTRFELISLKRLPSIGSDHFPILIDLFLCEEEPVENKKETLEAKPSEQDFVEEKIEKAIESNP